MKTVRSTIFEAFSEKKRLKFSEIEKRVRMRSNVLAYYIQKLQEEGVLEKDKECYMLTQEAEKDIPTKGERTAVPVVLVASIMEGKILLLLRNKRPYQGYWGLPGGKILLHEMIEDSAVRILYKETGIMGSFRSINAVMEEKVGKKHGFILFLVRVDSPNMHFLRKEGDLRWFDLQDLPKNIIPSDKHLIKKKIDSGLEISSCLMEDDSYEALIN